MKIVYATDINAGNIHNWSGLGWYYREMLERAGFDVMKLDKWDMPPPIFHRIKKHIVERVQNKLYSPRFSIDVSKYYATRIHQKAPLGSLVISPNTVVLAYLKKDLKKILFADATFD